MADWQTFDLSEILPEEVGTALEGVQNVSNVITTLGNTASTILNVLKVFLTDLPHPGAALAQTLLAELQTIIDNLQDTGAQGLFLIPGNIEQLEQYRGGYPRFRQMVLQSLYDVEDPNRPQVGPDGVLGAFFLLFTAPDVSELIYYALTLENLIGIARSETELKYPAPASVTIQPANEEGQVPGSMLTLFTDSMDLTTLVLSWEEPKYKQHIFYDIFARNKFYIERSRSREGTLLTREKTRGSLRNPLLPEEPQTEEPVLDRSGNPIFVWEPVNPDDPFLEMEDEDLSTNFIAGTYSYIIRDLEKGIENGYYYRIRSVPKDTTIRELRKDPNDPDEEPLYLLELDDQTFLGSSPSVPVFGHLPDVNTSFDLPTALLNVYRAAYRLRFDVDVYAGNGTLQIGSSSLEPLIPEHIEQDAGLEEVHGGFLSAIQAINEDAVDTLYSREGLFESTEDIVGYAPSTRFVTTKGLITSSTALEDDPFSGARELFSEKMNLSEMEAFRIWVDKVALDKVNSLVPVLVQNDSLLELVEELYLDAEEDILQAIAEEDLGDPPLLLFNDQLRTSVHLLIQTVDRHASQGTPPNWKSVRIFKDIWPEADMILDRLYDLINALASSFGTATSSIEGTIEGLQRRLLVLDEIVNFLDDVIAFYARLENVPLASILFVPPAVGGVPYLVRELLEAGNPPPAGPGDFFAGVVLTIGGAGPQDVLATRNAIQFVFGV